uniref:RHS repeat-associated core domain-containing protein n=1 Tax=Chryseobacterium hispalense TaxID=1453492 RepID=UPI0004937CD4
KELQETGMYDYGARFYMPDIGRWGVHDPLSELQFEYSPYAYVNGNPIRFYDPTGMIGEDPDPKKIYGPKGGYPIEEVVIKGVSKAKRMDSSLSFMGIQSLNAYHASEDRLAAGIRSSKAALATEKFERNLAFAMGTFMMGGSNLVASAGWATFDTYMSYQSEEAQQSVGAIQLMALFVQLKHGNISAAKNVLDDLAASQRGTIISNGITKKGVLKADYLFENMNDAKNFGSTALGSSKTRMYDGSGKWVGWENKAGDQVYWGHGDWGKGVGSSTFPHLNYNINGQKGHLFLNNKINNRGQSADFNAYFNLGK